ncbi:TPA: hypothetical protein ACF632_004426 [Salmonella enterica]
MVVANINRKSAQSQGDTWQDTLRGYKAQMTRKPQQVQQRAPETDKTTLAHKGRPGGKTPQKPTSEPQQAKPKQVRERIRPEGMNRRQWKNVKHMRRILAFWPELFDLDNPKPLKVGVLDDIQQDIAAYWRWCTESRSCQLYAPYPVQKKRWRLEALVMT